MIDVGNIIKALEDNYEVGGQTQADAATALRLLAEYYSAAETWLHIDTRKETTGGDRLGAWKAVWATRAAVVAALDLSGVKP